MIFNKNNVISNVKNIPGIYAIKNNNRKYPIYNAFEKYGLNNFEIIILKTYNIFLIIFVIFIYFIDK